MSEQPPLLNYGGPPTQRRPSVWGLLIYLPSVVAAVVAVLLDPMGRDILYQMNSRQLAVFIGFWWAVLATLGRIVAWIVTKK